MRRGFTLILLAFATVACWLADPAAKPKNASKTPLANPTHKRVTPTSSHAQTASSGSKTRATTAKTKYVRGKNGKLMRVAVRAPAPSYQLHPDPERYREIQQALADKGYFKGEVNGEWGNDSVDALRRFQADRQLDDDGHLNALTLIGLGLGPKHDHDLGTPAPIATPNIPNNSVPNTAPATPPAPVGNSAAKPGPPMPPSGGES